MKRAALLALALAACAPKAKPARLDSVLVTLAADGSMESNGKRIASARDLPKSGRSTMIVQLSPHDASYRNLQLLLREAQQRSWPVTVNVIAGEKPKEPRLSATMDANGQVALQGRSSKPQLAGALVTPEICREKGIHLLAHEGTEISVTLALRAFVEAGCDVMLNVSPVAQQGQIQPQ